MKKDIDESDICDLDPNKICDNCCKCIERRDDADYGVVLADLSLPDDMLIVGDDIESELGDPIEYENIDPKLLAEWEAKLKEFEAEDELAGDKRVYNGMTGSRKKRSR